MGRGEADGGGMMGRGGSGDGMGGMLGGLAKSLGLDPKASYTEIGYTNRNCSRL